MPYRREIRLVIIRMIIVISISFIVSYGLYQGLAYRVEQNEIILKNIAIDRDKRTVIIQELYHRLEELEKKVFGKKGG